MLDNAILSEGYQREIHVHATLYITHGNREDKIYSCNKT